MAKARLDTPKKVLDEFHSYMGSGLSMEYHINGMPEKMFIEELVQRDVRRGDKNDHRETYKQYIKALCLQKKMLCTSDGKLFTFTLGQKRILEEKGLIQDEKVRTRWLLIMFILLAGLLMLYMSHTMFTIF